MKNEFTGKYEGYIYCIDNTINFKSYIGQTTRTIEHRFKSHKTHSKNIKRSIYLYSDTSIYGWDAFTVSQVEKVVCDTEIELKKKLDEKEIFYIKKYNTLYPNGYNVSKGGWLLPNRFDSVMVYKFDLNGNLIQSYNSMSDAALNNNVSQADISNCCNGKKVATVGGFYWSKNKDFVLPNIQRQKKRIVMLDKSGELIRDFDSATDAAIIIFGDKRKRTGISKCLAKESKTAYGYHWCFLDEYIENGFVVPIPKIPDNQKNIICVETGVVYKSIKDAERNTGILSASICRVCKDQQNTAGGFRWMYYEDYLKENLEDNYGEAI